MFHKKLILLIFILFSFQFLYSQEREYMIKSAALEKMTRFIKWPENAIMHKNSFRIGIITNNKEVLFTFKYFYSDQSIRGRDVAVEHIDDLAKLSSCNIVFVENEHSWQLSDIVRKISGKPILLVCQTEGYAKAGAHINFIIRENKLKYEINESQMKQSGFYVWALLLNSAKIVHPVK